MEESTHHSELARETGLEKNQAALKQTLGLGSKPLSQLPATLSCNTSFSKIFQSLPNSAEPSRLLTGLPFKFKNLARAPTVNQQNTLIHLRSPKKMDSSSDHGLSIPASRSQSGEGGTEARRSNREHINPIHKTQKGQWNPHLIWPQKMSAVSFHHHPHFW